MLQHNLLGIEDETVDRLLVFTADSRASTDSEPVKPTKMPDNKETEPVAVSGVNRRTMILFSKKAKQRRLSAIQLMAAKDFEKKEPVKIDSTRTDMSELSRRSSANGFTVKLPLQAESSGVNNAKLSVAKRPPAKRQHASGGDRTEPVICNGGVAVRNDVVAGVSSRGKSGISDDMLKKSNQHKIRILDSSQMLNGIADSSDLGESGSSRYPIRGSLFYIILGTSVILVWKFISVLVLLQYASDHLFLISCHSSE